MKKICMMVSAWMMVGMVSAAVVQTQGGQVTIRPEDGQAKVIRLEVINDNIIRVRATSEADLPLKPASLMIVPQTAPAKGSYTISEDDDEVTVKTKNVKAVVDKESGRIKFYDAEGKELLEEAKDGKQFKDFTVPERELGMKTGYTVPEEQKHGLTWQMKFDSPEDEAFYGLGQHQSEEFNMKGKNEDLFQYNTKVSIPFVLSNKNYGLLWDSYSYCRFGNPNDYLQLNLCMQEVLIAEVRLECGVEMFGWVREIGDNIVEIEQVDSDGMPDGITYVRQEDIIMVGFGGLEEKRRTKLFAARR